MTQKQRPKSVRTDIILQGLLISSATFPIINNLRSHRERAITCALKAEQNATSLSRIVGKLMWECIIEPSHVPRHICKAKLDKDLILWLFFSQDQTEESLQFRPSQRITFRPRTIIIYPYPVDTSSKPSSGTTQTPK